MIRIQSTRWMLGCGIPVMTASVLVASSCQRGRVLEIRVAHSTGPQSLIARSAEEFARLANEELEGAATVIVFGSGQLGGDAVAMQKLKVGTVQLAVVSTVLSSAVQAFGLFEMPYLVRDRAHMRRIEQEIIWPRLAPLAEREGYRLLAVWENGFRHITNRKRPVVRPEDLRGLKLRIPRSPWRARVFDAFGATPVPLAFSEVFVALQTGVVDGQENPLSNVVGASLHEVQTYLSLTGHVYSPAYVVAGVDGWRRLPVAVREILGRAARQTQAFAYATAAEIDAEMLRILRAKGMLVNEADREQFREASRTVYHEFASSEDGEGAELVVRALELATEREDHR